MQFKFHLFIQRHINRTYTVTPIPFYDLTVYGSNLEELKTEITEALQKRIQESASSQLHQYEFNKKLVLRKVQVEVRPVDKKKRTKRREKVPLVFSLLVDPQEEGQIYVTIPRLGFHGPSFYIYTWDELESQAQIELANWLDNLSLDQLQEYTHARSETLDVLEVDVALKKLKERERPDFLFNPFAPPTETEENHWALKEVGVNLTAQVVEGRYRKTYRRDDIVEDLLGTLSAPRNNSLLVMGPSESGKTAVIHEVVRRIHAGNCPEPLKNRTLWMLSPDRIIAGAQFIGTWEERINNIVDECRKKGHILYVEDLPGLLEIGRWSKSDANVGLALRPHIASGEVIVIGEGLPDRVQMGDNLGPSFMNLFRRVQIAALSEDETVSILSSVARDLEREHDVRILPEANDAATQLSHRFLPYRSFPGKAIRLLEESVSDVVRERPRHQDDDNLPLFLRRKRTIVNRESVLLTFSRISGMPEFIINDAARLDLDTVDAFFQERILGQPGAVQTVVNLIATVKAGLNDPNKPMGTLMFIGPTGVGKTQMAKTLATYLFSDPNRMIRFDMSEYRDIDGVAKLIGAFGKEGELTRRVREQPFSVVLLDEFEKADPRIFDIFLQVLGEGRLTDAAGKTTYFHNTIVIMTSNLGAGTKSFTNLGFTMGEGVKQSTEVNPALRDHYKQQVEDFFRPEFVNRLDDIVVFGQLAPEALHSIAARELTDILQRDGITRRNLLVEIEDSVIELVLQHGYSPQYGARPLKREIERLVVNPMSRELAQRNTQDNHLLRVGVDRATNRLFLKNVPIEDAGQYANIELTTALGDAGIRKMRVDTAQLVEGIAVLRRKMADWLENDSFKEMKQEKDELLAQTHIPGFYQSTNDAPGKLNRFYFLDRLIKRVQQLYDRAEYLEDFAVLINRERDFRYQADLARDYEELYRDVSYAEIELRTAHLPHRNQAILLLRPVGLNPNSDNLAWLRRLARMYLQWAERKDYDHDLHILAPNVKAPGGAAFKHITAGNFPDLLRRFDEAGETEEIALLFEGTNVFGFLKGERGLHRLERDGVDELVHVQVFAIPDGTNIANWLRDYREIRVDIAEGRRPSPPAEKLTVVRMYSLDKQGDRFVRDMRTNVRSVQTRDVVEKGQIDDFILAYLQQEERSVAWEDRFPPTFPF